MSTALTARQALERAARPQAAASARPAGGLSLSAMRLRGRKLDAEISAAVTDAALTRSIEVSSNVVLTVSDAERRLLRSGLMSERSRLALDTLSFELSGVAKQGSSEALTFEDRQVALLRRYRSPRKARRGPKMTRALFAQSLVREVREERIGFYAPELTKRQPVAADKAAEGGRLAPYEFSRGTPGQPEDSWTCLLRLADEVGWRCFVVAGVVWFLSDDALMAQAPIATLRENAGGVGDIDFDWNIGKRAAEARLTASAERWAAPPGSVVVLAGVGPANGRWLVSEIRRSLSSVQADVTLTRRRPTLPEPAGDAVSAGADGGSVLVSADVPAGVQQAYAKAGAINDLRQGYLWGGGHGDGGVNGYDCSGGASACLIAAGYLSSPQTTVGLKSWGEAGEGRYMTVWVHETGIAERSHVWLEFKGFPNRWWEAGGTPGALTGWRSAQPSSGFSPRHYPGT